MKNFKISGVHWKIYFGEVVHKKPIYSRWGACIFKRELGKKAGWCFEVAEVDPYSAQKEPLFIANFLLAKYNLTRHSIVR